MYLLRLCYHIIPNVRLIKIPRWHISDHVCSLLRNYHDENGWAIHEIIIRNNSLHRFFLDKIHYTWQTLHSTSLHSSLVVLMTRCNRVAVIIEPLKKILYPCYYFFRFDGFQYNFSHIGRYYLYVHEISCLYADSYKSTRYMILSNNYAQFVLSWNYILHVII